MSEPAAGAAELSRVVAIEDLGPDGRVIEVVADAAELAALARRFDLVSLDALSATVTVRPTMAGEIDLAGELTATVVQRCVVSLEPVAGAVGDQFALRYSREFDAADEAFDDGPLIEPWPGDAIDVGEVVAQHLGLALDPYPRAPEATLPAGSEGSEAAVDGPFAALRGMRDRMAGKT